jgi:hypothetical protein
MHQRMTQYVCAVKEAGVYIFDWGRSELLGEIEFELLSDGEKQDRTRFWNYYSDGVCRLFYEALRAYYHAFCTSHWNSVLIEIHDFDSVSDHDFAGRLVLPLGSALLTCLPSSLACYHAPCLRP